jgi:hypothetical protein
MEDKKFANILRMNKNSLYLSLWPIQVVQYEDSSKLWLYQKSNPVTPAKILYMIFSHGSDQVYIVTKD